MARLGLNLESRLISSRLKKLINLTYKLLPTREEGADWKTPLTSVIEEFSGFFLLINDPEYRQRLLEIVCRLKGLNSLERDEDFYIYRRMIFEIINSISELTRLIECQDQITLQLD